MHIFNSEKEATDFARRKYSDSTVYIAKKGINPTNYYVTEFMPAHREWVRNKWDFVKTIKKYGD